MSAKAFKKAYGLWLTWRIGRLCGVSPPMRINGVRTFKLSFIKILGEIIRQEKLHEIEVQKRNEIINNWRRRQGQNA